MFYMVRRTSRSLLSVMVMVALVLLVEDLGLLNGADTYFYDTFIRLSGPRAVSDRIVIVAIDAPSLKAFGRWPLRRNLYADLLDRLKPAAAVGFDLLLTEPTDDDPLLGAAIKRHGRVILPAYFNSATDIVNPSGPLSFARVGHIHLELGIDMTARQVFHSLYGRVAALPSLSSALYELFTGKGFPRQDPLLSRGTGSISQRDLRRINFYGPPDSFARVPLADVLRGKEPAKFFADKIVLVGVTAPGSIDEISTPFSQSRNRMPGVEVHANILNNLLDNSAYRDVPGLLKTALVLLVSLLLCLLYFRLSEKIAVLLWAFTLFLMPSVSFVLLKRAGFWLTPSVFLVSMSLVFISVYLYRLDRATRKLDREYEVMTSLLGWDNHELKHYSHAGGIAGFLSVGGINGKIQRQVRMTEKLLNLHKQLELALKTEREAMDNQVRFVELLSHEYRTPLAIIRANLDILEMKYGDRDGQLSGNYAKMKRAMARLVEVMDTSLGRERLGGSPESGTHEEIELTDFVRSLVCESRELWTERRLELDIEANGEGIARGDRALLKTALLNLLDNAIKYSPDKEPIQVRYTVVERDALVTVTSRGAIIRQDDLEKVFDKFFRGRGSNNTQGAGLGLYLVRKIINQFGGTVTLSSSDPEGTVAEVRIPVENRA